MGRTPVVHEIAEAEAALGKAMLVSDADTLGDLLSPRLVFTDQAGHVYGKEDDLKAHASGLLKLSVLDIQETTILEVEGAAAVVNALARLAGTHAGSSFEGLFRYTRTWCRSESGRWQVLAGHVSAVHSQA